MMIPINIIFKIVRNNPDTRSINIKMCRQNAPKSIDDYPSFRVSYDTLDFSSVYNLQESLRVLVSDNALKLLIDEPTLPENKSYKEVESLDLNDLVGDVVAIPFGTDNYLNHVELWQLVGDFIESEIILLYV